MFSRPLLPLIAITAASLTLLACDVAKDQETGDLTLDTAPDDTAPDDTDIHDTGPDPGDVDADGDGWTPNQDDCDDTDPAINPGAEELCDGIDNDCDGVSDADADADKDGLQDCADFCPIQVDISAASGGDGSFERPFRVIQDGIDAAPALDCWEVEVHAGTYEENIDFRGYPVDVRSLDGPAVTTIDGRGRGSVVTFQSDEPPEARLYAFTITNGSAERGAGIRVQSTATDTLCSPTIVANIITGNATSGSPGMGGGLLLYRSDSLVTENTISGNDACHGSTEDGCDGGGIDVLYGAPTILGNQILGNTAGDGGGIWVAYSDAFIAQNLIAGNNADDEGATDDAGIFVRGQGGGVDLHTGTDGVTFANNIVSDNTASTHGGGLSVFGYYDTGTSPSVVNNVFAFNRTTAADYGAGLLIWGLSSPQVTNNVIYDNDGSGVYNQYGYANLSYNDVYANTTDWAGTLADPTGTSGNLRVDPAFQSTSADGDPTNDNFHLRTTSPLKDAGDPSLTDADGTRSDLGAYGGPYGSW